MAFDWQSSLSGATAGSLTGASIAGGWGALPGALIGGISGGFGSNRDKKVNSISTFDPQQKQLFEQYSQALQGGGGPLADVYGQFSPDLMRNYYQQAYSQPQYQDFQQNIVPGITGSFRGKNLQNSSYLGRALSQAGTNVQNNLNAQMAELLFKGQQSAIDRRANALRDILNMQTHVNERPQSSIFDNLMSGLAGGAGDFLAQFLRSRNNITPNIQQQIPQSSGTQPTIGG